MKKIFSVFFDLFLFIVKAVVLITAVVISTDFITRLLEDINDLRKQDK